MFTHYSPNAPKVPFIKITTQNSAHLTLSKRHILMMEMKPIPESRIKTGDTIMHASRENDVVISTKVIHLWESMSAPFMESGYLVVNNTLVSNYVAFVEIKFI